MRSWLFNNELYVLVEYLRYLCLISADDLTPVDGPLAGQELPVMKGETGGLQLPVINPLPGTGCLLVGPVYTRLVMRCNQWR